MERCGAYGEMGVGGKCAGKRAMWGSTVFPFLLGCVFLNVRFYLYPPLKIHLRFIWTNTVDAQCHQTCKRFMHFKIIKPFRWDGWEGVGSFLSHPGRYLDALKIHFFIMCLH